MFAGWDLSDAALLRTWLMLAGWELYDTALLKFVGWNKYDKALAQHYMPH